MKNPLLDRPSVPDFSRIKPAHFLPAITHALAGVTKKVAQIKKAPASFENTVVPLESLFADIEAIFCILGNLTANTYSRALGAIDEKAGLRVSAATKTVFQDAELGALFREVYQKKDTLWLDDDDRAILKHLHHAFEASGALLDKKGQKKIREIDAKLITLAQKFKDNMQAAPKQHAVLITDEKELGGLSQEQIAGFAANARKAGHKKGWLVVLERLLVDELLERAESASFREKIATALNRFGTKAPYDNRPVIAKMQKLRQEYATLLGYKDYASFARSRAMMTNLPAVRRLLTDIGTKAMKKFEAEMRDLEKFSAKNGGPVRLKPCDVAFWAGKQRDALYQFDAAGFAEYLELGNVLDSLFAEAGHLFGLKFRATKKYSTFHPDVVTFDVTDKTGKAVGILHVDSFARPGTKSGGAWMSQIQPLSQGHPNVIIFNMNIAKPPKGKPALVGLSQYITFYHEMGHALQGLIGTNVDYPSLQGTAASADFTEFHSTVNERRGTVKKNLQTYALHVVTGKPASSKLIDALIGSKSHFESRDLLKLVQNSLRDLEFHTVAPKNYKGDTALEKSVALDSPYSDHIRPYPLARFDHLFSSAHSGYAAGYVNYLIAQMLAADGFEPFEDAPYDKKWAARLDALYRRGSGGDPAELYRDYRGRDAAPDAMLRDAGIVAEAPAKKRARA